jgi:hypothetical protein
MRTCESFSTCLVSINQISQADKIVRYQVNGLELITATKSDATFSTMGTDKKLSSRIPNSLTTVFPSPT